MLVAGQTPEENFRNLHAAGCIHTGCELDVEDALKLYYAKFCILMVATRMNPCDGCYRMWDDPSGVKPVICDANVLYYEIPVRHRSTPKLSSEEKIKKATTPNNGPFGEMSIAKIAEKHGVSKSLVRRLKLQGKLDTLLEEESANVS